MFGSIVARTGSLFVLIFKQLLFSFVKYLVLKYQDVSGCQVSITTSNGSRSARMQCKGYR